MDPSRYPRDFATFTRFAEDLARLGPRWDLPEPMSIAFFEEALQRHGANAEVALSRLPVSYTHLDVYKRQALRLCACVPRVGRLKPATRYRCKIRQNPDNDK